ncbi:MAG: acyl-CoA dehydrogenase family protein [Alphaproteobacteria bacterium]|nr:acyl-CoA dehydrogenase family protein [Alphaproteobacteria bacterium]
MNFQLDENMLAIQHSARLFAEKEILPYAAEWDKKKIFPVDCLRQAASLGFASIYIREELHGSGLDRLAAAVIFEELAAACPSTAAYLSIHNMVSGMIESAGTPAQQSKWLPLLATMKIFSSYCLTEPGSGSDAASLKTRAEKRGNQYCLNGTKAFISGGGHSDFYIVMAKTDIRKGAITAFIVEKNTPGLSFGKPEQKLGWNSQPTAMVFLENCLIPAENMLGKEGEGFKLALKALDGGRINIAACSLGAARASLEHTTNYMKERQQFGKPIAAFQALQFRLADMATQLEAARLMVHKAACLMDNQHPETTKMAAMAKRFATDIGFAICDEALQLHGGYGYLQDFPIERYLRDTRVHRILEGTNEIMRLIIARQILGKFHD